MNDFNDKSIEKTIQETSDGLQPNAMFTAELEEKLRKAHKPRKPLTFSLRGFAPVLTGAAVLGALTFFMVWVLNTADLQPTPGNDFACPVTPPNGSPPPGETGESQYFLGNGELWTTLWPDGRILMEQHNVEPDGSFSMKWGFVRGEGVVGPLTVEGRRLDDEAEPLRADIPDGYGDTGLQILALIFPTTGCWEVTGHVGDASLTFVTEVIYSSNATPIAEATPGVIIDPNATSSNTSEGGYDFRGGKLFLAQPLPESPDSANVYAFIENAPATIEEARALADRFDLQGDFYTIPFLQFPDKNGYVLSDGKRVLTVFTATYFTYSSDFQLTNRGLYGTPNQNAEAVIKDFLNTYGFDFPFKVTGSGANGSYSVQQLSPEGLPMLFDTYSMQVSRITLGADGNVAYAEFNLMNYNPAPLGSYSIISAQDALDALLSDSTQVGYMESGYGPATDPPVRWYREYPDNQLVTISANLTKYDSAQTGGHPLLFLDGIQAIGETASLEPLTNYRFVVATGQFVVENGVRKFSVETVKTDVLQQNIVGVLRNEGGEIIITDDSGEEYVVIDPPADLPLNTDAEKSYLGISGIFTDGKLDWSSIQFFEDVSDMGGGGGGGGYGFYPLNLSGTPIPFPDIAAPQTKYTPEELASFLQYIVKEGDTLESIAAEYNITAEDIMSVNYMTDPNIGAGWILVLPGVPGPTRLDGVEGTVDYVVFVKPDGRERTEYTFILKESGQYYQLAGENLEALLNIENMPVKVWGSIQYDSTGLPRLNLEKFEELYPGLEYQVLRGSQKMKDYNGTQIVLLNYEGKDYVQLVLSGTGPDLNYYSDGEILVQGLLVPGETYAGYPAIRVFYTSPAVDPFTGQPLEIPSLDDLNRPMPDPYGNDDSYVPPDLILDSVELSYYAVDPLMQYDAPYPSNAFQYVQPIWHLHGHYTNGPEADFLVQALKQEFLSPNFGQ